MAWAVHWRPAASSCATPVGSATPRNRITGRGRDLAADAALVAAFACGLALLFRLNGGFEVGAWAPAGIVLALCVAGLVAFGLRPSRLVQGAAGTLLALGAWGVLSTRWGGVPDEAWRLLGQSLTAALALCLGGPVAAGGRGRLVLVGVLCGITLNAAEILIRPVLGSVPDDWVYGRTIEGTVGYHNAQANLLTVGICLGVWGLASRAPLARALSGGALGALVAVELLTQSRAGLGTAVLAVAVVVVWARSITLALRVVPVSVVAALLTLPLRDVDRALVSNDPSRIEDALQGYAGWALLAVAGIALASVPVVSSRRLRLQLAFGLAAIAIAGATVGLVVELRSPDPFGASAIRFDDSDPNLSAPGATRLISLSLNGRRDAWRIAWAQGREDPVHGGGQGTFAGAWTAERRLTELYILQPHSILFELFSELGIVGLGLFLMSIVAAGLAAVRGPDRLSTAAALGVLAALSTQAAVDWTWSFPGLVAAALLVVGAVSAGRRRRVPAVPEILVGVVVLVIAIGTLTAPWMAQRSLDEATRLAASDPTAALARIATARGWNPWNARTLELRGLLAEKQGAYRDAADDYSAAARLSQSPWLNRFREARAAGAEGDVMRKRVACALGHRQNPAERRLFEAIC